MRNKVKYLIKSKNNNLVCYDDKYLEININFDDDSPLYKMCGDTC